MTMNITATWLGKRHFRAIGPSGHAVHLDARAEDGGEGQGNRPMELLLMGLAGCTGIDVSLILERMRQPLEQLEIEAAGTRQEQYPQKFTEIHLYYRMQGDVQPEKAWRAIHLSESKYCSASASLNAAIVPHLVLNGREIPRPEDLVSAESE
ncbi:MAG: OsmC family protein [Alicyclobacillus sp.]|nr:OsmC family protein [Alicyclobacillus sp.]